MLLTLSLVKIVNNLLIIYFPFDFEDKSYIVWCDYSSESFLQVVLLIIIIIIIIIMACA